MLTGYNKAVTKRVASKVGVTNVPFVQNPIYGLLAAHADAALLNARGFWPAGAYYDRNRVSSIRPIKIPIMKTLTKSFLAAVLGGAFTLAATAGPGPQYWNRPASAPAPTAAKPANDGSTLTCDHMLVRNTGPGRGSPAWISVNCTPEMLRTNEQCRSECGVAAPAKPEPTSLTCEHMLIRNTGPGRGSPQWISVNCTPEMLKSNPECQSACRS